MGSTLELNRYKFPRYRDVEVSQISEQQFFK